MKSVYDQNQVTAAALAEYYPAVMEMAKLFTSPTEMATALGFTGGGSAINHWMRGKNTPGLRTEKFAQMWLDQRAKAKSAPAIADANPSPKPAATGAVLMVICPDGMKDRAVKLLSVIGCEAVEI